MFFILSIFFFLTTTTFGTGLLPDDVLLPRDTLLLDDVLPLPTSDVSAFQKPKAAGISYRLPGDVIPSKYEILVEPFFEGFFNFSGEVTITAKVLRPLSMVVLHSHNLDIQSLSVTKENGDPVGSDFGLNPERHFLVINTGPLLKDDVIKINVKYMGVLNGNNNGFYRASYLDKEGKVRWLATTQFESTDARQAFPCFDEPGYRAEFEIKIKREATMTSISNTAMANPPTEDGTKFIDTYPPSVNMSTYLVAFVVSDFIDYSEDNHHVFARKDYIDEGRAAYALKISKTTLKAMEDFTGMAYQLSKITQIGIPDPWFAAGAMENWGLITYKERFILFKEGTTTALEKQRIATIVAHEYAHQWFGNLVSPSWWQYIWLNEGFARYFQFFAASVVEPEWRLMEQIVTSSVQYAMELDSADKTRPMSHDAQSPEQISALFDFIAYDKSSAVIRMMEHFVTTQVFKNGLRKYLKSKEYDVANEDDLWISMQEAINESPSIVLPSTIAVIMKSWSLSSGYPVLNVARHANNTIMVTQERFFLNESHPKDSTQKWYIPINYASSDEPSFEDTKPKIWLSETEMFVPGLTLNAGKWIVFNKHQTGYYRVNYDANLWGELVKVLNSADFVKIPAVNRAQILDDAFNLARSGRLGYDVVFGLMKYVERETDYIPLFSFLRGMQFLNRMMGAFENDTFKTFASNLLQAAYKKLGTKDTGTHVDRLNRALVLTWLCDLDDKVCKTEMKSLLQKMETTPIPPDLQVPVYSGGMIEGTKNEFDMLMRLYRKNETEGLEKERIIAGLGRARDKYLIFLLLTSSETMSPPDKLLVINSAMSGSEAGLETTLDYLALNFEGLQLSVAQKTAILKGIASRAVKEETMEKVEAFLKTLEGGSFATAAKEAATNMESNRRWLSAHKVAINVWMEGQKAKPGGAGSVSFNILMLFVTGLVTKLTMV